jgi:hypothetical protein
MQGSSGLPVRAWFENFEPWPLCIWVLRITSIDLHSCNRSNSLRLVFLSVRQPGESRMGTPVQTGASRGLGDARVFITEIDLFSRIRSSDFHGVFR